ncbi:sensor histidine kinase [Oerskovia jenensis]|uniref:sensor histidine kinase n=1 Tax=Oerskovia jenensis TaxID=162169 RepID=UPI0031E3A299
MDVPAARRDRSVSLCAMTPEHPVDVSRVGRETLLAVAAVTPLAFGGRSGWITLGSLVIALAALAVRRRLPWVAVLSTLAASVVDWRLFALTLLLAYGAGRAKPLGRGVLAAFAGVLAVGVVALLTLFDSDLYTALAWAAGATVFGLSPALLGSSRRLHVELVRAGWDQAAQLEREQRIVAEQARLQERARIAQEIHDSLGHELSLIALRGGALEVLPGLAPEHRATVTALRAGVTTAAERLSEIIGLLLDETDAPPRTVVGEPISALVTRVAESGVRVTLSESGNPGNTASLQYRAAYRVVQESLTNATKHAAEAPVDVRLECDDDYLTVKVRNAQPGTASREVLPAGGGRGLTGLRERVGLAGGVLDAGRTRDGGFEVAARLPRSGPLVHPAPTPEPVTATAFRRARQQARRALVLAVALPVVLVVTLGGALMAMYAEDSLTSRLRPETFQQLSRGTPRADLVDLLPTRQVPERRDEAGPARPEGSTCEYYRSVAGLLPTPFDVYRLCFRDGVLVSKDVFAPNLSDDKDSP